MRSANYAVRFTLVIVGAVCAATVGTAVQKAAPLYRLVDLGTPGGNFSWGQAINDNGDVAGSGTLAMGLGIHAFVYSKGVMRDLGTLGGESSHADAINNAGQVVGLSNVTGEPTHITHGFLYFEGVMTDLGTLGGDYSAAHGINNNGQITGISQTAAGHYLAFLYSNGITTPLGTLGGDYSYGWRINNRGDVVGRSATAQGHVNAFLYRNGVMVDLGDGQAYDVNESGHVVGTGTFGAFLYAEGAVRSLTSLGVLAAYGINNKSHIVGSGVKDGVWQGVVYRDGVLTHLNEALEDTGAGWTIVQANGINERGQIVAIGNYGGYERAVRLDPVERR